MVKFSSSNQIRWDITQSVTLASLFYFLYFAGKTCLVPYLTLYFRKLGLTGSQTGIVCGFRSAVWFLAAPLWTVMAKRFGNTRLILGTSVLIAVASHLLLTLIPPDNDQQFKEDCHPLIVENPIVTRIPKFNTTVPMSNVQLVLNSSTNSTINESSIINQQLNSLQSKQMPFTTDLNQLVKELKTFDTTSLPKKSFEATTHYISSTIPSAKKAATSQNFSIHKMALHLLPYVIAVNPNDNHNLKRLLSNYSEIKSWPKWKKKVLTQKIRELLDKLPNELFQSTSVQLSTTQVIPLVSNSSSIQTNETKSSKQQLNAELVSNLAQILVPIYTRMKLNNSSLTVMKFLNSFPKTTVLPNSAKQVLKDYMKNFLLINGTPFRQKKSLNNDETNIISHSNKAHSSLPDNAAVEVTSFPFTKILLPRITNEIATFLFICFIVSAGEIFAAPIEMLSDSSFHELLDELDSLNRYGKHKVFGIVATIVSAAAISCVVYVSPCFVAGSISRFNLHFYAYAALLCLAFLVVPFYPTYKQKRSNHPGTSDVSLCPTCRIQLCSECRHILLFFTIFIVGVMQAALQDFLLWQIHDLPHASELVYGTYISANALAALLALPIGRRLTSMFRSSVTIPISLCSVASQMLLCSFINDAWLVVPLQALNILGVPFLWVIINSELKMMISQDDRTSLRVIDQLHVLARSSHKRAVLIAYLCTYQGLAFSFGSFISGFAYDAAGGSLTPFLRAGSAVVGGWACFYFAIHCCCLKKRKFRSYSQLLEDSEDEFETFSLKGSGSASYSTKSKSNYVENGRKVAESRRKRRNRLMSSSSDEEDLEQEWSVMNTRRESRRM